MLLSKTKQTNNSMAVTFAWSRIASKANLPSPPHPQKLSLHIFFQLSHKITPAICSGYLKCWYYNSSIRRNFNPPNKTELKGKTTLVTVSNFATDGSLGSHIKRQVFLSPSDPRVIVSFRLTWHVWIFFSLAGILSWDEDNEISVLAF